MSIYFTLLQAFLLGTGMKTGRVVFTLYALKMGAQPFTVGLLMAMSEVLPTLLAWHAGRLADRFGCRWLLMVSAGAGALGMLISYLIPSLAALFATAVLYGLMSAFYGAPVQNLVGLQSGPQDRARNFSNFSLVTSCTGLLGPLLAGFTLDHAGPEVACLGLVLLFLAAIVVLVVWGGKLPSGTRTTKPTGSVRVLLSESGLWRVMATSSLVITGVDLFQVFMPIYGHSIGLSASAIGIILAIYASAAFVVRFFMPTLIRRLTIERLLAYSFLIGAAGFLLVPFFKSIVVLSLVSFFFGLGMGLGQPLTIMMTFSNSSQGRSGEAMGLRVTVNNITRMASQVLFGSIGSAFGVFPVFWVNALLLASGWAVSHPRAAAPAAVADKDEQKDS
ncbi:MAG: MFS transporter [Deltaproteobacteria bacterium]|nr:MFS transporter [Deltaproteobacteria bacterium]